MPKREVVALGAEAHFAIFNTMESAKYYRGLTCGMTAVLGLMFACGGRVSPSDTPDDGDPGGSGGAGARGGQGGSGALGGANGSGGAGGTTSGGGSGGAGASGGSGGAGASGGSGGAGASGGSGGSGAIGGSGGSGAIGGSGGSGAIGGSGGGGGGVPTCVPGQSVGCVCVNGQMGAQVCRSDGTFGDCVCQAGDGGTWEQQQLARLRKGIIGNWAGVQNNPWGATTGGPCPCTVTFGPTHYTGHSPGESCSVFYWGSNIDSPLKTYLLDDVKAGGEGMGHLTLFFDPGGTTNTADIQNLVLSADTNELRFEVLYNGRGPLKFELKRQP